jgi:hypothetical protein
VFPIPLLPYLKNSADSSREIILTYCPSALGTEDYKEADSLSAISHRAHEILNIKSRIRNLKLKTGKNLRLNALNV